METTSVFFIATGLAMDALAIAIVSGFATKRARIYHAFRMAVFFGLFQAVMPVLGWAAGAGWRKYIEHIDHWIAFGLLTAVGLKMIYESFIITKQENKTQTLSTLLMLAIATSIDAFAIGLTLSMLAVSIIYPAIIIGVVTFCVSLAGFFAGMGLDYSIMKTSCIFKSNEDGQKPRAVAVRQFFERTVEMSGGLILIGIGIKILIERLNY